MAKKKKLNKVWSQEEGNQPSQNFRAVSHDILESEQRLRQLVAAASEAILLVDSHGKIRMCNPRCEQLFGYQEGELLGATVEQLVPAEFKKSHEIHRSDFFHSDHQHTIREGLDLVGIKKDGEEFPVEISLSSFEVRNSRYVTVFMTDISERKLHEEELRREKEIAQLYLDLANSIFLVLNTEQEVVLINKKGCEILDVAEDEILGKNWFHHFISPDQRKKTKKVFKQLIEGESKEIEFFENDIVAKDGKIRTIEWHNAALTDATGQITGTISSGVDITQRKEAQSALFNAIHEGQEQERSRLSREIHDSLSQQLAATKMLLSAFEKEAYKLGERNHYFYKKAIDLLTQTANEARNISHDLAPPFLYEKGLLKAIRKMSRDMSADGHIKCFVRSLGMKERLHQKMEIGLYRITQELLNNIIKHSKATEAHIYLTRKKRAIRLIVSDNGIGFQGMFGDLQHNGIGLRNIKSRVKGLRGKVAFKSSKEGGALVLVKVPIE